MPRVMIDYNMTSEQMNRLLKILGCNHLTACPGALIAGFIDHVLDHLEDRVKTRRDG